MTTGIEELKGRLEVLLGAKPEAPVDESQKRDSQEAVTKLSEEHRQRVGAAGGELLGRLSLPGRASGTEGRTASPPHWWKTCAPAWILRGTGRRRQAAAYSHAPGSEYAGSAGTITGQAAGDGAWEMGSESRPLTNLSPVHSSSVVCWCYPLSEQRLDQGRLDSERLASAARGPHRLGRDASEARLARLSPANPGRCPLRSGRGCRKCPRPWDVAARN